MLEKAVRRLRAEPQSMQSLEIGELNTLEKELWRSLRRVFDAKAKASQRKLLEEQEQVLPTVGRTSLHI